MILTLLSLSIFLLYLAIVLRYINHVPQSLSETFYLIGDQPKCYLFTATLWVMVFTLMPPLLDITADNWDFLAFLALTGIGFVGAAPFFHDSGEGTVHTVAAIIAAVFGLAWCAAALKWWSAATIGVSLAGCTFGAYKTKTIRSGRTFWLEMVAFASVYLSAIIKML